MALLLDLLPLEAPGGASAGGGPRYVCGYCRDDLWDDTCIACARRVARAADELALLLIGAL